MTGTPVPPTAPIGTTVFNCGICPHPPCLSGTCERDETTGATQRFFGVHEDAGPATLAAQAMVIADRVELVAYDKDGRQIGRLEVHGNVRLKDPVSVWPRGTDQWEVDINLTGHGVRFPYPPHISA